MQRMLTMGGFCPAPAAVLLWLFQLTSSSPEQLAACCRVMLLRSAGPAAAVQAQHMGVYRISGLLNGRPVYGHVRNRRSRILNGKTISVKNSWHISGSVLDPHSMVFWIRIQVLEKTLTMVTLLKTISKLQNGIRQLVDITLNCLFFGITLYIHIRDCFSQPPFIQRYSSGTKIVLTISDRVWRSLYDNPYFMLHPDPYITNANSWIWAPRNDQYWKLTYTYSILYPCSKVPIDRIFIITQRIPVEYILSQRISVEYILSQQISVKYILSQRIAEE